MVVLAKVARVVELSLRVDSARPWLMLPAVLGQDLVLVAAVGMLAVGLGRLRGRRSRIALTVLLLAPIGLLLPADVVSHLLIGAPLTLQRLRGDEGATLKDLHLIGTRDLAGGLLGVALALLALWPALHLGPRVRWLCRLALPRSLLVVLLIGCASSLLQSALLARNYGLAEQPVFTLLDSVFMRRGIKGIALSESEWWALYQPAIGPRKAPAAPRMEGPAPRNVVIFFAEGIPFRHTGFDARFAESTPRKKGKREFLPNPTPNLTRLQAQHGLLFDRYYTPWHASIQAIFSLVCSAFPPMSGDIVRIKPRIDCGEFSELMRARGITPGLFHAGEFNFYNKLALLGRRGNAIELDAAELSKTSTREKNQWGIDDRAMVDATFKWIDSLPRNKPFAALLIPITAHYPYWTPSDWVKRYKGSARENRFLDAVAFQDQVFGDMVRGFQERGLYDDTLFIWLGDHGHYVGEPNRITENLRGFYEPNLHTPLLLVNSRMFPASNPSAARTNSRLSSHVDLLPTILNALGKELDPRHQGQSLLAEHFDQRRMFFGADNGKFVGFIEGNNKFVVNTQDRRTEYYDLSTDPLEVVDLSDKFPERMLRYTEDVIRFSQGVTGRINAAPVLHESVSVENVYELFIQHATVRIKADQVAPACVAGKDPGCKSVREVIRIKSGNMQGEKRRCLMVKLPAGGEVELSVHHHDTLDLLTGTIAALPGKVPDRPTFRIRTFADGVAQPTASLSSLEAVRVNHPKAMRELRFVLSKSGKPLTAPAEICLQLTALGSQ